MTITNNGNNNNNSRIQMITKTMSKIINEI